jgi:hypothetical protein
MDTFEGIAEWWIRRQRIQVETHRVASALAQLIELDVVETLESGGVRRYRLKQLPTQPNRTQA